MMTRPSPSLWYLWAALFGIVAALVAGLVALAWIRLGVDPWLASLGLPRWVGHGAITLALVALLGRVVQQVRAPH
jgi:H+/Cl- antiporter ClcA